MGGLSVKDLDIIIESIVWCLTPAAIVYGIYAVIFILCMLTLIGKRDTRGYRWQITSISVLFIAATTFMIVMSYQFTITGLSTTTTQVAKDAIYAVIFVVSDAILIYRCYLVWNERKLIILLPSLLLFATIVISLLHHSLISQETGDTIFFAIGTVINVLVTSLTAGRIWYINRISKKLLNFEVRQRYTHALNLILESGVITVILLIISLILHSAILGGNIGSIPHSKNNTLLIMNGSIGAVQPILTAMLPTAMLLRVAWGYDTIDTMNRVQSVQEKAPQA